MDERISTIENNVQDRNSIAWNKLCEYIDELAENGTAEFDPRKALGKELFLQVFTLPESISKLKKVTTIDLYGSKLKRIPPEIGLMESLEDFDPYTSHDLHWFPYEIMDCQKLKDSRISTRVLYGNFKNRMEFPALNDNPVRYFGEILNCSICKKEITYEETNQLWITLRTGTDSIPLLVNLCSKECEHELPSPPKYFVQYAHKGGADLIQPPDIYEIQRKEREEKEKEKNIARNNDETGKFE
jgi:Leucine-rich repeat (LRR) protein